MANTKQVKNGKLTAFYLSEAQLDLIDKLVYKYRLSKSKTIRILLDLGIDKYKESPDHQKLFRF